MAGLFGSISSGTVSLSAATAKTVLQLVAPSNQRLKVLGFSVSFDGTSGSATPAAVSLIRQTTAGTMSSLTPVQVIPASETLQATAQYNATAEPTSGNTIENRFVHPQTSFDYRFPLGQEPVVGGGGRMGLVVNAPAAVDVRGVVYYEE